jgi:hypothetical protein
VPLPKRGEIIRSIDWKLPGLDDGVWRAHTISMTKVLGQLAVFVMVAFANAFIGTTIAIFVFYQLRFVFEYSQYISLAIAILVAVAVHFYILIQPKIRAYLLTGENT